MKASELKTGVTYQGGAKGELRHIIDQKWGDVDYVALNGKEQGQGRLSISKRSFASWVRREVEFVPTPEGSLNVEFCDRDR